MFLICVTTSGDVPKCPRSMVPGFVVQKIIGNGLEPVDWGTVQAAARAMKETADRAGGGPWWVHVGHNQYWYHTEWQFFACFGPPDWESDTKRSSRASMDLIHRQRREAEAREKAENKAEAARRRTLGVKKSGKVVDAIVQFGDKEK